MTRWTAGLALVLALLAATGCGDRQEQAKQDASVAAASAAAPAAPAAAPATPPTPSEEPHVTKRYRMQTSLGDIVLELDSTAAPKTVANFDGYVAKHHYDGTIFHRVIGDFMIQGGGFDAEMNQRPTDPPVENEAANKLKNRKYTIAMARTSAVHSATSQFFINVKDNDFLDFRSPNPEGFGYCVFGAVVEGQDVVDKIKAVPTAVKKGMRDVPVETVTIVKVEPLG